jgi:hypothetical protein
VFDEDSLTTVGTGSMSLYFNHHYTFGYFIYAAAVVAKFEPGWLTKWKSQLAYMVRTPCGALTLLLPASTPAAACQHACQHPAPLPAALCSRSRGRLAARTSAQQPVGCCCCAPPPCSGERS